MRKEKMWTLKQGSEDTALCVSSGASMKEFIEALRNMSIGDFLRLLVLMTPAVGAIWAAFRWAYGERLKTVQTNLLSPALEC